MSKKKRYWCPTCQLYDEDDKKILTIDEEITDLDEGEEKNNMPPGTRKIIFYCQSCEKYIPSNTLRKIIPFLNQVTIVLSIGSIFINIMIFKDSCKIAGSKTFEDATETLMILWEDFIQPKSVPLLMGSIDALDNWKFRDDLDIQKDVHFLFEPVMINVDFSIGFPIDKSKLNKFMNRPQYKEKVFLCFCEKTSSTHVNIKMFANKPSQYQYYILCYDNAGISSPHFLVSSDKVYHRKKPKEKYTTLIVFSSSQVILTGRYPDNMEDNYDFFMDMAWKNKDAITENISKPVLSLSDYLNNLKSIK